MRSRCIPSAMALALALGGLRAAWGADTNISAPPGSRSSPALPLGEDEEVRRLLKAAEGMHQRADELRVRADALEDRNKDDEASDLDDRASDLDEKARLFEDEADRILHHGGGGAKGAPGHRSRH